MAPSACQPRLREHYAARGSSGLSDAQLLAVVLGNGAVGRSAEAICLALLQRFGDLRGLRDAPPESLAIEHGLGPVRAIRLHAALQLGARMGPLPDTMPQITTPAELFAILSPRLNAEVVETFWSIGLDRRNRPVFVREVARGTRGSVMVDPSEVFRPALQLRASAVIVAHNHPSGCPEPSSPDLQVTQRLARAGEVLGIPLLDHIIIAGKHWTSLAERGHLTKSPRR